MRRHIWGALTCVWRARVAQWWRAKQPTTKQRSDRPLPCVIDNESQPSSK
jgi:hypothetical protein